MIIYICINVTIALRSDVFESTFSILIYLLQFWQKILILNTIFIAMTMELIDWPNYIRFNRSDSFIYWIFEEYRDRCNAKYSIEDDGRISPSFRNIHDILEMAVLARLPRFLVDKTNRYFIFNPCYRQKIQYKKFRFIPTVDKINSQRSIM